MIILHRLNEARLGLNPDLIERAEANPDTVITLTDGKKLLVSETLDELIELISSYRSYIVARASTIEILEAPRPELELIEGDADSAADESATDHRATDHRATGHRATDGSR